MSDRQTSDEGARKNTPSDYRVIEEPIFWRRSRSVELTPTPPPDKPEPVRRPAKVARQLALTHHLQAAIERGLVADQAALARKLGLTRALTRRSASDPKRVTCASSGSPFGLPDRSSGLFDSSRVLWAGLAPRTLLRCAVVPPQSERSR